RLVPGAGLGEVARGEHVVHAPARPQVGLDGLDVGLHLGVRQQALAPRVAHDGTTSNCSWCSKGSAWTVISGPTSSARSLRTEASSPASARATSGLTRSRRPWPRTPSASFLTSS